MSEDKDEGILSRWSQRKRGVALEEQEEKIIAPEVLEAEASEHEALLQANCEEAESIDLDTIDEDSDLSIFLKEGVPELLKRQALSKLWKSSPVFANIDGLNDYDEDFGAESLIMKTFKSAYKVGSGYAKEVIEEVEELPEAVLADDDTLKSQNSDQEETQVSELNEDGDEALDQEDETIEASSQEDVLGIVDVEEVEQNPIKKVPLRQRLSLEG